MQRLSAADEAARKAAAKPKRDLTPRGMKNLQKKGSRVSGSKTTGTSTTGTQTSGATPATTIGSTATGATTTTTTTSTTTPASPNATFSLPAVNDFVRAFDAYVADVLKAADEAIAILDLTKLDLLLKKRSEFDQQYQNPALTAKMPRAESPRFGEWYRAQRARMTDARNAAYNALYASGAYLKSAQIMFITSGDKKDLRTTVNVTVKADGQTIASIASAAGDKEFPARSNVMQTLTLPARVVKKADCTNYQVLLSAFSPTKDKWTFMAMVFLNFSDGSKTAMSSLNERLLDAGGNKTTPEIDLQGAYIPGTNDNGYRAPASKPGEYQLQITPPTPAATTGGAAGATTTNATPPNGGLPNMLGTTAGTSGAGTPATSQPAAPTSGAATMEFRKSSQGDNFHTPDGWLGTGWLAKPNIPAPPGGATITSVKNTSNYRIKLGEVVRNSTLDTLPYSVKNDVFLEAGKSTSLFNGRNAGTISWWCAIPYFNDPNPAKGRPTIEVSWKK